jgi:hypothetical protein
MKFRRAAIVLILLSAAGLGRLLRPRPATPPPVLPGEPAISLEVRIKKLTIRRIGDHAQATLTASFDQSGQTPVHLEPPLVSLLTASGTPVPRYVGVLLPEPILTGPDATEVVLHYWLPTADLEGPLTLEATGKRYPLPQAGPE